MAGRKFYRADLQLIIQRDARGGARIDQFSWDPQRELLLSAQVVRAWLKRPDAIPLAQLRKFELTNRVVIPWLAQSYLAHSFLESQEYLVPRIILDIADRELAALPWEQALLTGCGVGGLPINRVSSVFPHIEDIPLTLPLRFLQVDPQADFQMTSRVQSLFGDHADESVKLAVETAECTLDSLAASREKLNWPTAEILHFDQLRTLATPDRLLSTAAPETPGTLGWLSRLTDTWQTRLVVLRADNAAELAQARRLLEALAARGGPAGLAVGDNAPELLPHFYEQIIHDFPLDVALLESLRSAPGGTIPSLFIGNWRAESLRVSRIATGIERLGTLIQGPSLTVPDDKILGADFVETLGRTLIIKDNEPLGRQSTWGLNLDQDSLALAEQFDIKKPDLGQLLTFRANMDLDPTLAQSTAFKKLEPQFVKIGTTSQRVADLGFSLHEIDGLLPLAGELRTIREDYNLESVNVGVGSAEQAEPAARFVNSSLWARTRGRVSRLKPKVDSLVKNQAYQLGIQIGSQDRTEVTFDMQGVLREQIKWSAEMNGAWIEVGVTGLDFEVLGDPVQELWLPREADSSRIYFTIVPRQTGISRLRFCIYNEQNLVQSHRLVAAVNPSESTDKDLAPDSRGLAAALGVSPDNMPPDTHFAWRCEYSLATEASGILDWPRRALSIAANEWNDQTVITVKGADKFNVSTPGDLKDYVERVRDTLQRISCQKKFFPSKLYYAFGLNGDLNAASPELLQQTLPDLALVGWQLYDLIFPANERAQLEQALSADDSIIAVANILAEKVIPWSLLYSRKYRKNVKTYNNRPVAYDTCLAALPDQTGNMPVRQCGQHASCLIHADQVRQREQVGKPQLLEETVVCPLHFWGFRHIIESPAQQVSPGENSPKRALATYVTSQGAPKAVAGFNSSLKTHIAHLKALQALFKSQRVGGQWSESSNHDTVIKQLEGRDPQIIYLFCHARKTDDSNNPPPCLEFDAKGFVTAGDLDYYVPWATNPLVFLNGCETAAFSPEALSPFVRKFVRDREAAGVIATETPVWELFAAEFAEVFFLNFLAGKSAGESLLMARRVLLAKLNPLGLTYTLYASAGLILKQHTMFSNIPIR